MEVASGKVDELVRGLVGPYIDHIKYDRNKEEKYEIRNLILVIVTLIAAVTFQAGINPPGGLWQDNQNEHVAGTTIFAYRKQAAFYVFLFFNTLAFTTSAFIIFSFTQGFPFSFEIRLAIISVVVTYACAVSAITPPESANLAYVLLVALLPIIVRSLIRWCIPWEETDDSRRGTTDDVAAALKLEVDELTLLVINIRALVASINDLVQQFIANMNSQACQGQQEPPTSPDSS